MAGTERAWSIVRRLDKALMPFMGPAQIGPYDEEKPTVKPCPLCGEAFDVHDFERETGRPTRMHCPTS